jgi:AbrB family looped-hinge helix DNA binding protein
MSRHFFGGPPPANIPVAIPETFEVYKLIMQSCQRNRAALDIKLNPVKDCPTMETKLSTKGQVVLPAPLRRKLGLRPGDSLDADVEGGRIVLTPRVKRSRRVRILVDLVTGLPVLSAGPHAATLSSEQVSEILSGF